MKMKNIKLYDYVIVLKDKDFITPTLHVKKGSIGSVVYIVNENNQVGYIVEIDNQVYGFEEDEIEVIKLDK